MSLILLFGNQGAAAVDAKVTWLAFDTAAPVAGAITGDLAATESGADTAAASGRVVVTGLLAATESGSDTAALAGRVLVQGTLSAQEVGSDTASIGSAPPEPTSQNGFVLVDFEPASWWKRKPKAMPERVARAKLKKAARVIAEVVAQPLPVAQQEQAIRQAIAPMLPEMPGFDWRGIFRELIAQENARQQMQALIQRARDADDEDVILLALF